MCEGGGRLFPIGADAQGVQMPFRRLDVAPQGDQYDAGGVGRPIPVAILGALILRNGEAVGLIG